MTSDDVTTNRGILLSARMQFSSTTQPIRDSAIDSMVEYGLMLCDADAGVTSRDLAAQGVGSFGANTTVVSGSEMTQSLKRLVSGKKVVIVSGNGPQTRYRLAPNVSAQLWETNREAERRFERVVERLFQDQGNTSSFAGPFFETLSYIFSRLGETYVKQLQGKVTREEISSLPSIRDAVSDTTSRWPGIHKDVLFAATTAFFRTTDPDYDAIKWNLGQNYYIAKALGLDPSGRLLSRETLADAAYYLDTNILISALEPRSQYHRSFRSFSTSCAELQIPLYFCQITINELRGAVARQRGLIERVAEQIPDATAPLVDGVFYEMYREARKTGSPVDLDQLFAVFEDAPEVLHNQYGAARVDDLWFTNAENSAITNKWIEAVKRQYQETKHRTKSGGPALHDALLLQWVERNRKEAGKTAWLVTLDSSLSGVRGPEGQVVSKLPFAITLDALVQWMSPIVASTAGEDFAAVFSDALKSRILPQEKVFELADFLIFAEMEWSCKELPAEDVENCIRHLKRRAPGLDPSKAEDRETLSYEITKFFADPSREYRQELERQELEIGNLKGESAGKDRSILELERSIAQLEARERKRDELERRRAVRTHAIRRLPFCILAPALGGWGVYHFAIHYGKGDNNYLKLLGSWSVLTFVVVSLFSLSLWAIEGQARLGALGGPFKKWGSKETEVESESEIESDGSEGPDVATKGTELSSHS